MPTADDNGFVGQFWVVALFDAGIEGVAIHVGDCQIEKFGVRYLARTATRRAAGATLISGQAISAEYRHGFKIKGAQSCHNG